MSTINKQELFEEIKRIKDDVFFKYDPVAIEALEELEYWLENGKGKLVPGGDDA